MVKPLVGGPVFTGTIAIPLCDKCRHNFRNSMSSTNCRLLQLAGIATPVPFAGYCAVGNTASEGELRMQLKSCPLYSFEGAP